jgi:hypothetical protein
MARNELEYIFRDLGTIDASPGSITGRADDLLFRPTLQLDGAFDGASLSVAITVEKSIDPLTAEPDGGFVVFASGITADGVVELPVCFGVRAVVSGGGGGPLIRVLLGGLGRTTHLDGITQGPS